MKIIVNLKFENKTIPLDYRKFIISFLKKSLTDHNDGMFFDKFYSNNTRKEFAFALKFNNPKFTQDNIELLDENCSLILTAEDKNTVLILYNSIIEQKNKKFNIHQNSFTCKNVSLLNDKEIIGNTVVFKFVSPLCVREHFKESNKDFYYSIEDGAFEVKFLEMLKNQLPEDLKVYLNDFKFIPLNAKKTVVKMFNLCIAVTIGEFAFQGDNKLLNYMYRNGIGSRKNSGFGLLEIAR